MEKEDNFPLEYQDSNTSQPTVYVQYQDIITSIYLSEKEFTFLWFVPITYISKAMVGYFNYGSLNRRNNFYHEIPSARKAYLNCKEALKEVKDCKLVWGGSSECRAIFLKMKNI